MYSSYVALFYRKRLPQQNGDRRKRNLHAFGLYVGQGRVLAPPPPPTRDKKAGLVYYGYPPPPRSHGQKSAIFRKAAKKEDSLYLETQK
jgi:hypothetical protein